MKLHQSTMCKAAQVLAAITTRAEFEQIMAQIGVAEICSVSKTENANALASYLKENCATILRTEFGEANLVYCVIRFILKVAIRGGDLVREKTAKEELGIFEKMLKWDGYSIDKNEETWNLRQEIPELPNQVALRDELSELLHEENFESTKRYLDSAFEFFSQGKLEDANSNLRKVYEDVLNKIAGVNSDVLEGPKDDRVSEAWKVLAVGENPFLRSELNEWNEEKKKKFVLAVYARLSSGGPHPPKSEKLSDEFLKDDETIFRLHLVMAIVRLFLKRRKQRSVSK